MATVNSDIVRSFTAMCRAIYQDGLVASAGFWQEIATLIPSTLQTETYSWFGEIPVMRQWLDERQILALKEYGFTLTNLKFEATIAIQRSVIEDDQTGQVKPRVLGLAEAANQHYDKLLFDVINSNPTAYDSVAFYGAHTGYTNSVSGGTTALSAASIQTGIQTMKSQTLPNGEPLMITPTHLVVHPNKEFLARQILNSAFWPDSSGAGQMADNPLQGLLKLIVSPRLSTTTEWHLFDCSHATKPFIIQQRVAPEFQALDHVDNNENLFLRDEFLYGVRSRDNAGAGLYQYAYKSAGA